MPRDLAAARIRFEKRRLTSARSPGRRRRQRLARQEKASRSSPLSFARCPFIAGAFSQKSPENATSAREGGLLDRAE
jgi:hypothetical protein